jgi:hypothetical protein
MSSLSDLCGKPVSMEEVKARVTAHFEGLIDSWLPLETDVME